jgi:hypothetical protein
MMTPHEKLEFEEKYKNEIAAIKALTLADIAQMRAYQVMEKGLPEGLAPKVGDNIGRATRTVETWRVNPDCLPEDLNDPVGRRGYLHYCNLLLTALNGVFPPGADLAYRWLGLNLGNAQAVQGYGRMEAIMELLEEMRQFGEELDDLQVKRQALQEKMVAIITGWDTT